MKQSEAMKVPANGSLTENGKRGLGLDKVPRWIDADFGSLPGNEDGDALFSNPYFADPLASRGGTANGTSGMILRFPVDHDVNARIHLWKGEPWNLIVDAVVNSTNESMDDKHGSPGLHAAAGPGLAEECAMLGGCRTGTAKITNAYNLPARRVIHTVGPKYAAKYHTAAENALSHCYRSCLEVLIENELQSIAMGCLYTEAKNYPREAAAHVAIRTVRRFLERQKSSITAVVFCSSSAFDTEIYKRLLPLYFPRDEQEELLSMSKLPFDTWDENGETVIDERKIRIKPLPKKVSPEPPQEKVDIPITDGMGLVRRLVDSLGP